MRIIIKHIEIEHSNNFNFQGETKFKIDSDIEIKLVEQNNKNITGSFDIIFTFFINGVLEGFFGAYGEFIFNSLINALSKRTNKSDKTSFKIILENEEHISSFEASNVNKETFDKALKDFFEFGKKTKKLKKLYLYNNNKWKSNRSNYFQKQIDQIMQKYTD